MSSLYARYVPPSKSKPQAASPVSPHRIASPQEASSSHKRKRDDEEPVKEKVKKPKKEKKRKDKAKVVEEDEEDEAQIPKAHKAAFVKYQHSAELSRKVKEKEETLEEKNDLSPEEELSPELHGLTPLPQPTPKKRTGYQPNFSSLPSWIAKPTIVTDEKRSTFEELGVSPKILQNLQKKGLNNALPIQTAMIPLLLPGKQYHKGDICVSAPTGSGKTLAYLLPLIQALQIKVETRLRALVVVPTRELVKQARQEAEIIATGTGVKIGTAVGNKVLADEQRLLLKKQYVPDEDSFEAFVEEYGLNEYWGPGFQQSQTPPNTLEELPSTSNVDLLICTPGRLVEHMRSTKHFYLQHVDYLVIDEADQLLDDKFQEWVGLVLLEIKRTSRMNARDIFLSKMGTPDDRKVKKVILSATMTRDLAKLATLQLHYPMLVGLQAQASDGEAKTDDLESVELPPRLEEHASPVGDGGDKPLYLLHLIKDFLANTVTSPRILVFTNKTEDAERLKHIISFLDPELADWMGVLTKMNSKTGKKVLSAFVSGKTKVLIASDRVSRGLDVPDISAVISYDMPKDVTLYIHRVGRTARADKAGVAWSLYTHAQGYWFWKAIANSNHIRRNSPVEKSKLQEPIADDDTQARYERALEDLKSAVLGRQ